MSLMPYGPWASDFHTGMICAVVANSSGAKKTGGGSFAPSDFMYRPRKKQSPEDQRKMLKMFFDSHNEQVKARQEIASGKRKTRRQG